MVKHGLSWLLCYFSCRLFSTVVAIYSRIVKEKTNPLYFCLWIQLNIHCVEYHLMKVVRNKFMARAKWVLISCAARFLKPTKPSKHMWTSLGISLLYCHHTSNISLLFATYNYLHYTSSHPKHCKSGIPYSQFLRLRRLCSKNYVHLFRPFCTKVPLETR